MENYRIEAENERFKRRDMEFIPFPVGARAVGTHSHIHDAIELLYVTEGDFDMTCDNRTVHAQKGDVLLFRSNSIHRTVAREHENNFYWVLKISPRLIIKFLPKDRASDSLLWLSVNHENAKFHWHADELEKSEISEGFMKLANEYENPDANSELAMRIAAATVVLGLLRSREDGKTVENTAVTELVYKAIVYINDNYTEDISAEELSKKLNISYSYFSRCFKRVSGKSFREYLNSVRVNHGESLLLNTDKSVTEISELCGFGNVSYFIATYRAIKKTTPLGTRKSV